jgi:predicted DNA-binding transcriptional regulator AlpA
METKSCSTVQVAEIVGISPDTLYRWIREKKFHVPPVESVGRLRVRLWTKEEIDQVLKYKAEHYGEKPSQARKITKAKSK